MPKAKRSDWKTEPLPARNKCLQLVETFTPEEFDKITDGLIPQEMEDRWFIFYEAPFLYLHRSWTGHCIFIVRFESVSEGFRIAEIRVNRDPEQYSQTDDIRDFDLLRNLLGINP